MPRNLQRYDQAAMDAAGKKAGWTRRDDSQVIANENPNIDTRVMHVMVCDDGKPLYDQIIRTERGGGVFLPIDQEGRIGLQKQWRPQTKDMAAWQASYPNFDISELGRDSWEVPRGFAQVGESGADNARREAQEETQSVVVAAYKIGDACDNTAFSPHLTSIQAGSIDLTRKPADKPDPNEKLTKVQFFTLKEIKSKVVSGELYDAYTLSAIALYYIDTQGN